MTEPTAQSLSQMLMPARQTPAATPAPRRSQRHTHDTEKAPAAGDQARGRDDHGSRASDARADDGDHSQEKPFEKIVRRARESERPKDAGDKVQGEAKAEPGKKGKTEAEQQAATEAAGQWLSLQDVVKNKHEGDRPVITLKQQPTEGKADASAKPVGEKVLAGDVLVARKAADSANAETGAGQNNTATGQARADAEDLAGRLAKAGPQETQGQTQTQTRGEDLARATDAPGASSEQNVQADASGQHVSQVANARMHRELGRAEAQQREGDAAFQAMADEASSTPRVTFQAIRSAGGVEINEQAVSARPEGPPDGQGQVLDMQDVEIEHTHHQGHATRTLGQAASVSNAGQAAAAARGQEVAGGVVGQITNYLRAQRARAGDEMVLRLDPPEMGTVKMTLQASRGELRMMVETSNPRTLVELQREASVLMQRLSDNGVDVRRMEFVQSDTSNNGNGSQAGLAEQQSQQQGFGQSPREGEPAVLQGGEGLAQGQESEESPPAAQGVQRVEDDAINLWM